MSRPDGPGGSPSRTAEPGRDRAIRSYLELDAHVRLQIDSMRDEPDLAVRVERLAAVARGERELARHYARAFAWVADGDATGQIEALLTSARLMTAIVVATRAALGARVVLPSWTGTPWRAAAPALRQLATSVDPVDRVRALDELRLRLATHLDQTATESLVELVAIERLHSSGRAGAIRV